MRAYPHGFRISSSNLNPVVAWRDGVQMVALNWQSSDKGMMLNEGMFAGTGGWVLKPPGYRGETRQEELRNERPQYLRSQRTLQLAISIYAAQDLPLPLDAEKADSYRPCVKCRLHLERYDDPDQLASKKSNDRNEKQTERTKTRKSANPDFEGERLTFARVQGIIEGLSFLRSVAHACPFNHVTTLADTV